MNHGSYSPFLPSNSNAAHQPRFGFSLLFLVNRVDPRDNRLMAGVKRWIGNQAPSQSEVMRKSMRSTNMDTRSQAYNKAEIHTQATGILASQLLNPKVPQEELLEYHR